MANRNDELVSLTQEYIRKLRSKLLDTSKKNRLISFRHSERSRQHIRVIDELPDVLFESLLQGKSLTFKSLPEPDYNPSDEKDPEFMMAVETAKREDEEYIKKMKELDEKGEGSSKKALELERELKDRIREKLGWSKRKTPEIMGSIEEYAEAHGLNPNYEMPFPNITDNETEENQKSEKHYDKEIQTLLLPDKMDSKLDGMRSQYRTSLNEKGINTLFIAYGFLEWEDRQATGKKVFSPLYLQPISMTEIKKRGQTKYSISSNEEEANINLALKEKLQQEEYFSLPEIDEDEKPESYFEKVNSLIAERGKWKLRRFITIGHFDFHKLVIFLDLDQHKWPTGNPLGSQETLQQALVGSKKESGSADVYDVDDPQVEEIVPRLITDADSSQHSAIIDVVNGKNLALEGPPGTGKSQTITNIIGALLNKDKSVLFVAQKKPALDVVYKNLKSCGLGDFCMQILHNVKKQEVIDSLRNRLELSREQSPRNLEEKENELKSLKKKLNQYALTLNKEIGETGKTVHEILWANILSEENLSQLPRGIDNLPNLVGAKFITKQQYEKIKSSLSTLVKIGDEIFQDYHRLNDHPWFGYNKAEMSPFEKDELKEKCKELIDKCNQVSTSLDNFNLEYSANNDDLLEGFQDLIGKVEKLKQIKIEKELDLALLDKLDDDELLSKLKSFRADLSIFLEIGRDLEHYFDDIEDAENISAKANSLLLFINENESLQINDEHIIADYAEIIDKEYSQAVETQRFIEAVSSAIEVENPKVGLINVALKLIKLVADTDRNILIERKIEFLEESNREYIRKIDKKIKDLKTRREEQSQYFDLQLARDLPLNKMALKFQSAGFFSSLFSSEYRRTRRQYKGVLVSKVKWGRIEIANQLKRLSNLIEEIEAFNNNEKYKDLLSDHFEGLETDIELIKSVNLFGSSVNQTFPQQDNTSQKIRELLLNGSIQTLDILRSVAKQNFCSTVLNFERQLKLRELKLPIRDLVEEKKIIREDCFHLRQLCNELNCLKKISLKEAKELKHKLDIYIKAKQSVNSGDVKTLLGEYYSLEDSSVSYLGLLISLVDKIREIKLPKEIQSKVICQIIEDQIHRLDKLSFDLTSKLEQLEFILDEFVNSYELDIKSFFNCQNKSSLRISNIQKRVKKCIDHFDLLSVWTNHLKAKKEADSYNLHDLVSLYESEGYSMKSINQAFDRLYFRTLAKIAYKEIEILKSFSGTSQQTIKDRFIELDKEIRKLHQQALRSRILDNIIPNGIYKVRTKDKSEKSLIEREIEKKKRHIPLRDLLDRASWAIRAMKPCLMMSPTAVAQYLKREREPFDVVIIDEASQMRPEDAISALARAKKAVIVGDTQQLPPTPFFQSDSGDYDDEEELDIGGVDSILDMSLYRFEQKRRLLWHYRSKHEQLINFSNRHFYKDTLQIFPSPTTKPAIVSHYIKTIYKTKINDKEANALLEGLVKFMQNNVRSNENNNEAKSCMVVTMNSNQRAHLQDKLRLMSQDEPIIKDYENSWSGTLEPFEIKNLELVQGDERDVIFISTVYGRPNEGGKVDGRCFGPINSETGARRLNVLFTRAKYNIYLYTSMKANDIKEGSFGTKILKWYLEYAETGRLESGEETGMGFDSEFERWVYDKLAAKGYEVVPQVGVGRRKNKFRIDLGIKHPSFGAGYLLGIECDGATYHSSRAARDRDRIRQEILESFGWKIYRIWSTDWFEDPQHEFQKLVEYINRIVDSYANSESKEQSFKENGQTRDEPNTKAENSEEEYSEEPSRVYQEEKLSSESEKMTITKKVFGFKKQFEGRLDNVLEYIKKRQDSKQNEMNRAIRKIVIDLLKQEMQVEDLIADKVIRELGIRCKGENRSKLKRSVSKIVIEMKRDGIIKEYITNKKIRLELIK